MDTKMQAHIDSVINRVLERFDFGFDEAVSSENKWAIVLRSVNAILASQGIKVVVE